MAVSCWEVVKVNMADGMLWGGLFGLILGFILGMKDNVEGPKLGDMSISWGIRMFSLFGAAYGIFYTIKFCALS